jgi:hypothetical protein
MGIINTAGQLLLNCVFTQIASALGFIVFAIASACRYAGFTASGRLSAVSVLPPKQQLTNIYIYIYIYAHGGGEKWNGDRLPHTKFDEP